jgi:hypothetical protein
MSRTARIQKRQAATHKQTTKPRKGANPVEFGVIEIPLGKMLKDLADTFRADRAKDPQPAANQAGEQARYNPDAGNLCTEGCNAIPLLGQAQEGTNSKQAEQPSIQNQAQLADKWAYDVRMQLSVLLRRVGGSEAFAGLPASAPVELPSGLRGTLESTTTSLSQSIELLSALRSMVG